MNIDYSIIKQRLADKNIPREYVLVGDAGDGKFIVYFYPKKPKWLVNMVRNALNEAFADSENVTVEQKPIGRLVAA